MENMFKRFLSFALAVLMVLSYVPVNAFAMDGGDADDDIVVVDETPPETPSEGEGASDDDDEIIDEVVILSEGEEEDTVIDTPEELATALTNGGDVVLGGSFALTSILTIPADKTVNLNLGGFTLDTDAFYIQNNGTLTVQGEGTLKATAYNSETNGAPILNKGTLTLNANLEGVVQVIRTEGGNVIVNGGSYTATANDGNYSSSILRAKNGATVTINGGYFDGCQSINGSQGCDLMSASGCTVVIKGGTFTDFAGQNLRNYAGILTVYGGTFTPGTTEGFSMAQLMENVLATAYQVDENGVVSRIPSTGSVTPAYTSGTAIWGEGGGNAYESLVVSLYEGDKVIATASLNNVDGIINGNVYVTWSMPFAGSTDPYWNVAWAEGYPSINMIPTKVTMTIDGVEVATNNHQFNAADGVAKIVAAAENDGAFVGYYTSVADAIAAGDHVGYLAAGTYTVPTGKDLTITGLVDGVVFDMGEAQHGMGGADVTFNNVTFNWAAHGWPYHGLQHCGDMEYNNCTFNGTVFLYGTSEIFNNCEFNVTGNTYNVQTYAADKVEFNDCDFTCDGKSVMVYNEGDGATDLTVNRCTFTANAVMDGDGEGKGKAAIEIDTSLMPGGSEIVVDTATTAEGFSENTLSGSSLWHDKKVDVTDENGGGTNSTVIVAGETVKLPAYAAKIGTVYYETLQAAFEAVQDGQTIYLVDDVTINEKTRVNSGGTWYEGVYYQGDKSFTFDLNGFTLTNTSAVNDYLMLFKNAGEKANEITITNGTLEAASSAYCAICTSTTSSQQITINLENVNVIGNNPNGAVAKIRGGAVLNVKDGAVITGTDSYACFEAFNATVNIYEGAKLYQNGTTSSWGCLVGVSGNGTANVYGGYGASAKGCFLAMTSGGTINIFGGEWIAKTDGTVAGNNDAVLIAQSDNGAKSVINVYGGTFKGGFNCYGDAAGDAVIEVSGGIFNTDAVNTYLAEDYIAIEITAGVYAVQKAEDLVTVRYTDGSKNKTKVFDTLAEAITFAEANNAYEIELNDNCYVDELKFTKSILIIGGNFSLHANSIYMDCTNGTVELTFEETILDNIQVYGSEKQSGAKINGQAVEGYVDHKSVVFSDGETVSVENPEWVAKIGDVVYFTLQEAIDAAQANDTIVLIDDITYTNYVYASGKTTAVNIPSGKTFTLDLNGHSITGSHNTTGNYEMITICNGAVVTITDTSDAKTGLIAYTGTRTTADGWMKRCHTILNQGTLILNGGRIENKTPEAAEAVASAIDNSASWGKLGKFIMNGGTVYSVSYYAVRTDVNTHNTNATSANVAVAEFNGGTVHGYYLMDRGSDLSGKPVNNIDVTVGAGATITKTPYSDVALRVYMNGKSDYAITVSGEAAITGNITGIAARIGENYYATLNEAIANAVDGNTIDLLADVEISSTLDVSYNSDFDKINITFNGNGHSIKAVGTGWDNNTWMVDVAWHVVFNNVIFDGNNTGCRGVQFYTSDSTLNNVTVKNMSANKWDKTDYAIHSNASNLTVTGNLVFENCLFGSLDLDIGSNTGRESTSVDLTGATVTGLNKLIMHHANSAVSAGEGMEDLFVIENPDYKLVYENGTYYLVPREYVAEVNGKKYESFQDALKEAGDGATMTILRDFETAGFVIDKELTIDLGNHTITVTEGVDLVGIQFVGEKLINIKNGTLAAAAEAQIDPKHPIHVLVRNSACLILSNVTLSGTGTQCVLAHIGGELTLEADSSIFAGGDTLSLAIDGKPSTVKINTVGMIEGAIKINDTAKLVIMNGTFTMDVTRWCDKGLAAIKNPNGTYTVGVAPGSEMNPILLTKKTNVVTVEAGKETYFVTNHIGLDMTITGEGYSVRLNTDEYIAPTNGTFTYEDLCQNYGRQFMFSIVSAEGGNYTITFTTPVGSERNPEVITELGDELALAEGDYNGYFYAYTAPAAGEVTLSVDNVKFYYTGENGERLEGFDADASDVEMVVITESGEEIFLSDTNGEISYEIAEGEEILIQVVTQPNGGMYYSADVVWTGNFLCTEHSYEFECDAVCQVCHNETKEVSHSLTHVPAKAGTDCQTQDGNVEYWTCEHCDRKWNNANATGDPLTEVAVAGDHSYDYDCDTACKVCEETTRPDATHSLTHVEAKAGTDCQTADGNVEYWHCEHCGKNWDNADATGDPLTEVAVVGEHSYEHACDTNCQVCHEETRPNATHTTTHSEETCLKYEYWTCEHCGGYWLDEALTRETDAQGVVKAEPTHDLKYVDNEDGATHTVSCEACDEFETVVDAPHTYDNNGQCACGYYELGSQNNPIVLKEEDFENGELTVNVAKKTYYKVVMESGAVIAVNNTVVGTVVNGDPVLFDITAPGTHKITLSWLLGHINNPEELVLGVNENMSNGDFYYYAWTAPTAGELIITMTCDTWAYSIQNGDQPKETHRHDDTTVVKSETIVVAEGDKILVGVADNTETAVNNITFTASFLCETHTGDFEINEDGLTHSVTCTVCGSVIESEPHDYDENGECECGFFEPGSENNPIELKKENFVDDELTVDVEKETHYTVSGLEIGRVIYLDGEEVAVVEDEDPVQIIVSEEGKYVISYGWPVGHTNNPDTLVIGENTAKALGEYTYQWTAEEAGKLTITMTGDAWSYIINNVTSGVSTEMHTSEDDPVVTSDYIEVSEGDKITVVVSDNDSGEAPVFTAIFKATVVKFELAGMTATFGDSLALNFVLDTNKLNGDGHYAVVTKEYADSEPVSITIQQEDWKKYSGSLYYFSFNGIAAKEMADTITAVVYDSDGEAVTIDFVTSLREYCMKLLNREDSNAELKTLCVDMLNYGTAAQVYFGYNTDDLANSMLTSAQAAYATKDADVTGEMVLEPGVGYAGTSMTLTSQLQLNVFFYKEDITNAAYAIATFTDHAGNAKEQRIEAFHVFNSNLKYVAITGMAAADCAQVVTLKLYDSQGNVISTTVESVESSCIRAGQSNALYWSCLKYCQSAYAYFH